MNTEGQGFLRFAVYFDDGKLQRLGGGSGSLFVLGPEPRGLRKLQAGGGAVYQDGGDWSKFWLDWARHWLVSKNRDGPQRGPMVNAKKHAMRWCWTCQVMIGSYQFR